MTTPTSHGINPSVHVATSDTGAIILTFQKWGPGRETAIQSIELNRRTAKRFATDVLNRLEQSLPPKCVKCGCRKPRRATKPT